MSFLKKAQEIQQRIQEESNDPQFQALSSLFVAYLQSLGEKTSYEKVVNFKEQRLEMIRKGETPFPMQKGAKVVVHVIPAGFDAEELKVDISQHTKQELSDLSPLYSDSSNSTFNVDGFVSYIDTEDNLINEYAQFYRQLAIEAVDKNMLDENWKNGKFIYAGEVENKLIYKIKSYFNFLSKMGRSTSAHVFISLIGIKDYSLRAEESYRRSGGVYFQKDDLLLPRIFVEDLNGAQVEQLLKPALDVYWNAFGRPRCPYYDLQGTWIGEQL